MSEGHQIFLSYAKEDLSRVRPLARALESKGWSVFWDVKIPTGKAWPEVLKSELDNATCILVVWSKVSIEKRWVKAEADVGVSQEKLIPVRIDDVAPPFGFVEFQAASLVGWDPIKPSTAFDDLVDDIAARLEPNPTLPEGEQLDPQHPLASWLTFSPYSVWRLNWTRRRYIARYDPTDVDGSPVIYAANKDYLGLVDLQELPDPDGEKPLSAAEASNRITRYVEPEDLKEIEADQELLAEQIVFNDGFGQAKVPIRLNGLHPNFPNESFMPNLLAKRIVGDPTKGPHSMFLFVIFTRV